MRAIRKCSSCGSPITSYKENGRIIVECSYCGKPSEEIRTEDFCEEKEDGE